MKLKSIAFGFTVGLAAGAVTALLNAPKPGRQLQQNFISNQYDAKAQLRQIKVETNEVKDYIMKSKEESQNVIKTMGQEIKEMIAQYQNDIQPNIRHLKKDVENVKNRGEEIKQQLSKK